MTTGLRFAVITLSFFGALSQSSAATKSGYKTTTSVMLCDGAEDTTLCLNLPQEAPETVILRSETPAAGTSIASQSDLSGGALTVENDALLALSVDPLDAKLGTQGALASAQKVNDQIRRVEMHLKTVAPGGDLTVISAGH